MGVLCFGPCVSVFSSFAIILLGYSELVSLHKSRLTYLSLFEHNTTSQILSRLDLRNFLNKAIGIILNFAKPFRYYDLNLNSKLDLYLSCAIDFRNLNSMVTWCIN